MLSKLLTCCFKSNHDETAIEQLPAKQPQKAMPQLHLTNMPLKPQPSLISSTHLSVSPNSMRQPEESGLRPQELTNKSRTRYKSKNTPIKFEVDEI